MKLPKWTLGLAAVEAIPILFMADTLLARWRGWRFDSRFDRSVVLLAASAGFFCVLMASVRRGRGYYQRYWARLFLLIGAVAASVLAGEVVARVVHPAADQAPFHGHTPNMRRIFHPDPVAIPGVARESHYSTNSLGIRGPEIPAESSVVKILCLGGSTTECLYLDDTKSWTHRLMIMLNASEHERKTWVGDMGYSGYSTTMHLRFVERSPLLRKVDCLVMLVGFNDLNVAFIRHATRQESLSNEAWQPAWTRSRLLDLTKWRDRPALLRILVEEQDSNGAFLFATRKARQEAPLRDRLPDLTSALRGYEDRLRAIVLRCRDCGVRPIFLTQPVLWSDRISETASALLWMGWSHDDGFYTPGAGREGMNRFNTSLLHVCEDMKVECIDLSSMNGNEGFFYDDCHFTEAGADEVARLISGSIHFARPASASP